MKTFFPRLFGLVCILGGFWGSNGLTGETAFPGYWDTQFATNGINGTVLALKVTDTEVYAGGSFQGAGRALTDNIAMWDGTTWAALGTGCDDAVSEIAIAGSDVYAGGHFITAGGVTANHIARWDGMTWHAMGTGVDGPVFAIAVDGSDVYVGGRFDQAGGTPAKNIARWDGADWDAVDSGMDMSGGGDATVWDILLFNGDIIVGGDFELAGAVSADNVARWNGSAWQTMGAGVTGLDRYFVPQHVMNLTANGAAIVASSTGAHFAQEYFDGINVYFVYHADAYLWNGTDWNRIGSAIYGNMNQATLHCLDFFDGSLFTGGEFREDCALIGDYPYFHGSACPDIQTNFVARWDGADWDALGTGVNGPVYDLDVRPGEVWVGGTFSDASGTPSDNIGCYIYPYTGIERKNPLPGKFRITQNYPNPFNNDTRIAFDMDKEGIITLQVYDILGQPIRLLQHGKKEAGTHEITWNGQNDTGKQVSSGMYFYRIAVKTTETSSPVFTEVRKMILMK